MESDAKFFYANALEVAVSPFDFSLKFMRQGTPAEAVHNVPSPAATLDAMIVGMSPTHAKAMLSGLFKAVMGYESENGTISVPAEVQAEFLNTFGQIMQKK